MFDAVLRVDVGLVVGQHPVLVVVEQRVDQRGEAARSPLEKAPDATASGACRSGGLDS